MKPSLKSHICDSSDLDVIANLQAVPLKRSTKVRRLHLCPSYAEVVGKVLTNEL